MLQKSHQFCLSKINKACKRQPKKSKPITEENNGSKKIKTISEFT